MDLSRIFTKQHLLAPFTIQGEEIHLEANASMIFDTRQKAFSIGVLLLVGAAGFYKKGKYAWPTTGAAILSFYGTTAYFKNNIVDQELRRQQTEREKEIKEWVTSVKADKTPNSALHTRWVAGSTLLAIGDTLGFMNGHVEFCKDSKQIHDWFKLGTFGAKGVENVHFTEQGKRIFYASDDTAMSAMTERALSKATDKEDQVHNISKQLAAEYDYVLDDPEGGKRGYGSTTRASLGIIRKKDGDWTQLPYSPKSGGCGGAMRSTAIGRHYYKKEDEELLVQVAMRSGQITHTHPTGFLGAVASAVFVACALRDEAFGSWFKTLENITWQREDSEGGVALKYWSAQEIYHESIQGSTIITSKEIPSAKLQEQFKCFNSFLGKLYDEIGTILQDSSDNLEARDKLYASYAFKNWDEETNAFATKKAEVVDTWPGASGHDAPIIALIALLQTFDKVRQMSDAHKDISLLDMKPSEICEILQKQTLEAQQAVWKDLIERAAMHRGDSDSTAVIACSLYGYCVGFAGVPEHQICEVEFVNELKKYAEEDFTKKVLI